MNLLKYQQMEVQQVLHLAGSNPTHPYMLRTAQLQSSLADRRIWESWWIPKLNMTQQCAFATKRAHGILSRLRKNVGSSLREVILHIYLALLKPHLDYCIQFWSYQYRRDMNILERAQ